MFDSRYVKSAINQPYTVSLEWLKINNQKLILFDSRDVKSAINQPYMVSLEWLKINNSENLIYFDSRYVKSAINQPYTVSLEWSKQQYNFALSILGLYLIMVCQCMISRSFCYQTKVTRETLGLNFFFDNSRDVNIVWFDRSRDTV